MEKEADADEEEWDTQEDTAAAADVAFAMPARSPSATATIVKLPVAPLRECRNVRSKAM